MHSEYILLEMSESNTDLSACAFTFKLMAQVQMCAQRGLPVMRPVENQYGVQFLMPHHTPVPEPKESVISSDVIWDEILEEVFQWVELDTGKDLIYTHTRTNF